MSKRKKIFFFTKTVMNNTTAGSSLSLIGMVFEEIREIYKIFGIKRSEGKRNPL